MRRTRSRMRSDGLCEVARLGRLRQAATILGLALACLPMAAMVVLALVAALPVLAFTIPPGLLIAGLFALWSLHERRGRRAARQQGPVIPLRVPGPISAAPSRPG